MPGSTPQSRRDSRSTSGTNTPRSGAYWRSGNPRFMTIAQIKEGLSKAGLQVTNEKMSKEYWVQAVLFHFPDAI